MMNNKQPKDPLYPRGFDDNKAPDGFPRKARPYRRGR